MLKIDHLQELEYLTDASIISPQQLSSILSQLPNQTPLHAPILTIANNTPSPVSQISNLNLNEKQMNPYNPVSSPVPPPPAYGTTSPPILSFASALYVYEPTDAGDLAILPNDRVAVLEHMNSDCMSSHRYLKGVGTYLRYRVARSERTNWAGGHIPAKLRQRLARKGSYAASCSHPLQLRQSSLGYHPIRFKLDRRAFQTKQIRGEWEEIWEEDG